MPHPLPKQYQKTHPTQILSLFQGFSFPSIGPVVGAYIVKAFLTHDFKSYKELQKFVGTAPFLFQSGKKAIFMMRKKCDKDLRAKIHFAALVAIRVCKWARSYYLRKRNEGKTYGHALRALGNTLLKIAFAMLSRLEENDEALFLNAKGIKVTHIDDTTNPESYSNPEVFHDAHLSLAATKDVAHTLTVP